MKAFTMIWAVIGSILSGMMVMFGHQIGSPMVSIAGGYLWITCAAMLVRVTYA